MKYAYILFLGICVGIGIGVLSFSFHGYIHTGNGLHLLGTKDWSRVIKVYIPKD